MTRQQRYKIVAFWEDRTLILAVFVARGQLKAERKATRILNRRGTHLLAWLAQQGKVEMRPAMKWEHAANAAH